MPSEPSEIAKRAAADIIDDYDCDPPRRLEASAQLVQLAIDEATAPLRASHAALVEALKMSCSGCALDLSLLGDDSEASYHRSGPCNLNEAQRTALATARALMEANDETTT